MRGKSAPTDGGSARKWLSVVAWARTPHDTCSPIWNGLGSDKALTFNILLIVGHQATLRRSILPQRSNLFQSHWSNQWLTQFSYLRGSYLGWLRGLATHRTRFCCHSRFISVVPKPQLVDSGPEKAGVGGSI